MNNDQITTLILRLIKRLNRQMENIFVDMDLRNLTISEVLYVVSIGESQKVTMKYLAEEHHVAASATTRIIENLVTKGYVERFYNTNDRRQVFVKLTNQGNEMFEKIQERRQKQIGIFINKIPEDQKDYVVEILQALIKID